MTGRIIDGVALAGKFAKKLQHAPQLSLPSAQNRA